MGANAQTSVPAFTAGQVLTAQQQTEINTGIPVFATTTTRDAAFGGTGEKTLAEGQMAYIENIAGSSAVQYYDGAAWATLVTGGLTLVKTQTIGSAVSSVTVTNAFSATYENYKIIVSGGTASTTNQDFTLKLGASTTGYYFQLIYGSYSTSALAAGGSNVSSASYAGIADTNGLAAQIEIQSPFLAKYTTYQTQVSRGSIGGVMTGVHQVATSYTDFVLTVNGAYTITGGTIYVYGYQTS